MNQKQKRLPIGTSDFKNLRESDFYYIDKSRFIIDIVEANAEVLLLPRPRRFGKTLNLSMLRYFFEKSDEDRLGLFKDLAVYNDDNFIIHHQKYPVIYLTFKDVKEPNWSSCMSSLKAAIYEEYARHRYLLESDIFYPDEKNYMQEILDGTLEETDYQRSLLKLSRFLYAYYEEQIVILIDEYDTPLHAGYASGYYDEIINFMRNLLSGGFKDNRYLYKGVITGILQVAKESIFSGLNNLVVYTLLDEEFSTTFGFTEDEVLSLLKDYQIHDKKNEVSYWYNGYCFGGEVLYNPWSLLNYISGKSRKFRPYWVNTGNNELINSLITRDGHELKEEIGILLENGVITKPLYDTIVMRDLEKRDDLIWSFLLFSGYLKYIGEPIRKNYYHMKIPNEEIKLIYEELIERWFAEKIESNQIHEMMNSIETGDMILFEKLLRNVVIQVMSYHDFAGEPEKVYHALVLGMLVWLSGKYEIKSNRESGYGRYDIMLKPKDTSKQGIIFEFKKVDEITKITPEKTLENALKQIDEKHYALDLETAGIKDIMKVAIAFRGKELWLKQG